MKKLQLIVLAALSLVALATVVWALSPVETPRARVTVASEAAGTGACKTPTHRLEPGDYQVKRRVVRIGHPVTYHLRDAEGGMHKVPLEKTCRTGDNMGRDTLTVSQCACTWHGDIIVSASAFGR